jgi:proteasome lid subunit RPN8/RPN11
MTLTISRADLDEILRLAARDPAHEICGLLLGRDGVVGRVLPCRNVAVDTASAFEIDPAALFSAHRAARAGGAAILGHYHSHPNGLARPSPRDAAAAQPGTLWMIVAGDMAGCWRAIAGGVVEGMFEPVGLIVR